MFIQRLKKSEWQKADQVTFIRELSDIRSSLGFPLLINDAIVHHPEDALTLLHTLFEEHETITLQAIRGEVEIVVEQLITGKEFSCIVIKDEDGEVIALPPTEIAKSTNFFDYKSKYLPGLSRKNYPYPVARRAN